MSLVLIDSSVWIDYFKGGKSINLDAFEDLIDNNQLCVNDLILAELLPSLYLRKEKELIDILQTVRNLSMEIDWNEIMEFQKINLKKGINNVGIPDLLIVQNVVQHNAFLYSIDKHFKLMGKVHQFRLF